jgi:hypothetical protein
MANTLRFKRGLAAGIPTGVAGEPLFTTDTFDLYIGNGTTNTRFQKYIASGASTQLLRGDGSLLTMPIVLTSPANGQVLKYNGTSWVNDSDAGITGSGADGQVAYFTGATTQAGNNNLFWDATNSRLGINNATPAQAFDLVGNAIIKGSGATSATFGLTVQDSGATNSFRVRNDGQVQVRSTNVGNPGYSFIDSTNTGLYLVGGTLATSVNGAYTILYKSVSTELYSNGSNAVGTPNLLLAKSVGGHRFSVFINGSNNTELQAWESGVGYSNSLIFQSAGGNVIIGSTSNSGQRLQVTGDTLLKGSGNTSATTALTVQDVTGASYMFARNDGRLVLGASSTTGGRLELFANGISSLNGVSISQLSIVAGNIVAQFSTLTLGSSTANSSVAFSDVNTKSTAWTSFASFTTFNPTSGTATYTGLFLNATINQTGGANGITRGLYVNPTLTAAADWRSIEWSNNTGWGLYGAGTANNYLAGNLSIGTTSSSRKLSVVGTTDIISYSNGTTTGYLYSDNNGVGLFNGATATGTGIYARASNILDLYYNGNIGLRLNNLGRVLIGSTSDTGETFQVTGTAKITGATSFSSTVGMLGDGDIGGLLNHRNNIRVLNKAATNWVTWATRNTTGAESLIDLSNIGTLTTAGISTFSSSIFVTGSANLSSTIDLTGVFFHRTGFSVLNKAGTNWISWVVRNTSGAESVINLQNIGTLDVTGAATFSSSVTTGGNILIGATASSIGSMNFIKTGTSPVASRLTFGTDGTGYSFAIGKNQAGSVTDLFSILDSGAANFSSSIQSATAIAIGTTPDTNNPFKILKNLNTTVGIKFENTNTSSLAFSAVQLGTDITGGTAFTNLVYGSSGTSEAGVFKPSGTALINTGSGGLNFLAVSQPIRFFTSTGNGTLRASITNDGDFTQFNGTNPSASTTDAFRMYSADIVAGNAAAHFRTENGAVIKLYQETTGVGNAIFSAGGGTGVLDDSTFDGYTLRQIVKALRNQGILA